MPLWKSSFQWRFICISRLSGCAKSTQSDAPSSGISLLETRNNQQVLNLANMEGGRAQLLVVGPKSALRLLRCGTDFQIWSQTVCNNA
jgi:hypothetical protein